MGLTASYQGGPQGGENNFVLISPINISIDGAAEIRRNPAGLDGDTIEVLNSSGAVAQHFAFSSVVNINVSGTAGVNDTLTINYGFPGGGFFNLPITFNGDEGDSDKLAIEGGTFASVIEDLSAATRTILYQGTIPQVNYNAAVSEINLAADSGPGGTGTASAITALTFVLPADGSATLADDGVAGNGLTQLSVAGLAPTRFGNYAVAINSKNAADVDTVTLDADADFTSSLTIGANSSIVNVDQTQNLSSTGARPEPDCGCNQLQRQRRYQRRPDVCGAVVLGVPVTVLSTNSGAISFSSTVNGAQDLTVSTGGTALFGGPVGGTTALTSLTTTSATGTLAINGGAVTTTGAANLRRSDHARRGHDAHQHRRRQPHLQRHDQRRGDPGYQHDGHHGVQRRGRQPDRADQPDRQRRRRDDTD